jgi:hypothetical protein
VSQPAESVPPSGNSSASRHVIPGGIVEDLPPGLPLPWLCPPSHTSCTPQDADLMAELLLRNDEADDYRGEERPR